MRMRLTAYLVNFWLAATRQWSKLDRISLEFWEASDFTFLAGEEYYAKREAKLRSVLPKIGPFGTAVDIGCGDGRFTLLVSEYAALVVGYDVSLQLVTAARQRASENRISNAQFEVAEIGQVPSSPKADLITCFGVVSCIHEDHKLTQLIDKLNVLAGANACVLLIDTLGQSRDITKAYRNGYVARYREQSAYEERFRSEGWSIVSKVEISKMAENLVNNLYVCRRGASACVSSELK
jgi:2-polyprenyl-3-methyl-5-hydroxy-6-metoxy-1,4-benzoquinol methylase